VGVVSFAVWATSSELIIARSTLSAYEDSTAEPDHAGPDRAQKR
jgi:hypothetical protein